MQNCSGFSFGAKAQKNKIGYIEEISIRYQLIGGGGIRMSGIDVEDMTKQVKEKSAKHKKK